MPVELGPVRVYLMYMIPVCCLFLTFLLLYPELLVKYRFKPAICKVTHKVPWDNAKQEARIINEVKVMENGTVVEIFGANACNPMDCLPTGGGFMDKREWLALYDEDREYACRYDPEHKRPSAMKWVVYEPIYTSTFVAGTFVVMCVVLAGVFCFHMYVKYDNGDFATAEMKARFGMWLRCVSGCAGACQDAGAWLCGWRKRGAGYNIQEDLELEECEVDTAPPSYDIAREPPPTYNMVVLPDDDHDQPHGHGHGPPQRSFPVR